MNFKHSFNDQPTIASFTTLNQTKFPFFSFFYQINSKKLTCVIPKTVQTVIFLTEGYLNFIAQKRK